MLYHGDALEVLPEIGGEVMVTDPPYGMNLKSGWNGEFGEMKVMGDDSVESRDQVLELWGDRPALVFGRWSVPRPASTRMVLTWDKGEHVGMGDLSTPWKPNTEEIYVLGRGFAGKRTSSILRYNAIAGTVAIRSGRRHPTEKPLDLMRDLVRKCLGETVLDPFAGSGSTLVAALIEGRKAIGVEIEERYCEVAARRLDAVLDQGSLFTEAA